MTQFAVATDKQAKFLREMRDRETGKAPGPLRRVDAAEYRRAVSNGYAESYVVTPLGRLALELREALGPDRSLTVAGAKALVMGAPTRATKIRLMDDGLWKRGYVLGRSVDHAPAWLTEDGIRVREILMKHRVTF